MDQIGGSEFDEQDEVDRGIDSIMTKLDEKHDGLDQGDVMNYWTTLDRLLGVVEVADWIEHAVLLPHDVANKFVENHVTGYDFPELVENDGERLSSELGIEKDRYRQKIVTLVKMRMLGVGSAPDEVIIKRKTIMDECYRVKFEWEKVELGGGFSIHKYRIQRRVIASTRKQEGIRDEERTDGALVLKSNLDWKTVYDGPETEFVDFETQPGDQFFYRIEAWNAAGRSPWTTVEISDEWKRSKCNRILKNRSNLHNDDITSWSTFKNIYWFFYYVRHGIVFILALAGSVIKMKGDHPYIQKIHKIINNTSKSILGWQIIPTLPTDDGTSNISRVDGYRSKENKTLSDPSHKKKTSNDATRKGRTSENRNDAKSQKVQISRAPNTEETVCSYVSKDSTSESYVNIFTNCSVCSKKYKRFKRCRHHCSKCNATFCHKCGKTTHRNFLACKVPGDCICNKCLNKID